MIFGETKSEKIRKALTAASKGRFSVVIKALRKEQAKAGRGMPLVLENVVDAIEQIQGAKQ